MMADECKYNNKVPMVCARGFVFRMEFARKVLIELGPKTYLRQAPVGSIESIDLTWDHVKG